MAPVVLPSAPMRSSLWLALSLASIVWLVSWLVAPPAGAQAPSRTRASSWRATVTEIARILRANELPRLGPHIAGGASLWLPDLLVPGDGWVDHLRDHPTLVAEIVRALGSTCRARTSVGGESDVPSTLVVCTPRHDHRRGGVRVTLLRDPDDGAFRLVSIEHVRVRNPGLSARALAEAARRHDRAALASLSMPDVRIDRSASVSRDPFANVSDATLDALARTLARGCAMRQTNDPRADVPEHELLCPPRALRSGHRGPRARLLLDDASVWRLASFDE